MAKSNKDATRFIQTSTVSRSYQQPLSLTKRSCENGCEQDESAVSGAIRTVAALTTVEGRQSVSGRRSALQQSKPAEHISTVSTHHAYKREGLRPYRACSLHVFYTFHR